MDTEDNARHEPNSYFEGFDDIVKALDALTKAVTPDTEDDGAPPEGRERPCCNSYFTSFGNVKEALERLKAATEERLEALTEKDPNFTAWKDGAWSINAGANSKVTSNGIAIGAGAVAASATGAYARDTGATAVGRAASAHGHRAVALGKDAHAGTDSSRTTESTVQLGAGTNDGDGTLQFRDWRLVDTDGTIPADRLSVASLEFRTTTIARASSGFCNINDHAVNSIALDGQTVSFVLPAEHDGRARAFILRLAMQSPTEWGFPPSTLAFESDDEDVFREIEVGTTTTLLFTEVSPRRFIVSRKDAKAVDKPVIPF